MASKYWIKLYHEILHDPKMGQLSDRLWRRVMELFLLAGERDEEGVLPSLFDMSWTLRISEDELSTDLEALEKTGIICQQNGGWFVTKFAERQAPVDAAERGKKFRERKRKENYYGTDSERTANETFVDTEGDTDTDTEERENPPPNADPALMYRDITGLEPSPEGVDFMRDHVPKESLSIWRTTIRGWIASGYQCNNVAGMVDRFEKDLSNKASSLPEKEAHPVVAVIRNY